MTIIADRIFTLAGQSDFAALSGDFNPIHMDEVAARRTIFGGPVVHGVHLLCWALDSWLAGGNRPAASLERLKAAFHQGVLVGEAVQASVACDGEEFTLQIHRDQSQVASISGRLGPPVAHAAALPPMDDPGVCRAVDFAAIPQAMGSLPLCYSAADASRLFPKLCAFLPPFQLAVILATTRLVGMECPGLHSLYAAMDLSFGGEAAGPPRMNFRVAAAHRFGGVRLAIEGPGFRGVLRTFLRPAPRAQAAVRELAGIVAQGEFSEQCAVVIGGSRGLGEVAAKLLALGGADVTITYHLGRKDAEAIAAEVAAAGGKCAVAQFDCNRPAPIAFAQPPQYLYYFATPHIASGKTIVFSEERFAEYCRYYVTNFARTLLAVAPDAQALHVFYPSTIFLDEAAGNLPEYCAAKAAGEEVCRQLARRFPAWRICAPRLPRMATDQNNGLVPAEMEAPEIVVLRHLREMKRRA
jgi:acyl dehydratase